MVVGLDDGLTGSFFWAVIQRGVNGAMGCLGSREQPARSTLRAAINEMGARQAAGFTLYATLVEKYAWGNPQNKGRQERVTSSSF